MVRRRELQGRVRRRRERRVGDAQEQQQRERQQVPLAEGHAREQCGKREAADEQRRCRRTRTARQHERRDQRPQPNCRRHKSQSPRTTVEHVLRDQRQHDGEVVAERADDGDENDDE